MLHTMLEECMKEGLLKALRLIRGHSNKLRRRKEEQERVGGESGGDLSTFTVNTVQLRGRRIKA